MSCHFHMLRRRRAAEAALKAANAPVTAEAVKGDANTPEKETAPQKAAKGRKKGADA